jgi:aryl-alcohol dehydrogenase-like predicted oxidoreductase
LKNNISRFGYGCYRVNDLVDDHYNSLKKALLSGINVIDTSANYSDGGSEKLVGKVVHDLIREQKIKREDITLVTKGGYIQGQNLTVARGRIESGNPFTEVFEFSDKLWHCISPDFLQDQFERQFSRLGLNYVDTYLLHNPEYSLSFRSTGDATLEETRNAFYDRIRKAFVFLEEKVKEGLIGSYGISSNTFTSYKDSTEFVSLERFIEIAEEISDTNHFDSVQFPLNLFESGAVSILNNSGGTKSVLELAHDKKMCVYINRPLNAVTSTGLVRLADFKAEEFKERDFIRQLELVKNMESDLADEKLPAAGFEDDELKSLAKILSTGKLIEENWKYFGSIEHFNDMIMQVYSPRLVKIIDAVNAKEDNEHLKTSVGKYIAEAHRLMSFVSNYYKLRAEKRNVFINKLVNEKLDPQYHNLPLSQKALLITSSAIGVDCVLLGMRKMHYVDDAIAVSDMSKITNAEEILKYVSSELLNVKT